MEEPYAGNPPVRICAGGMAKAVALRRYLVSVRVQRPISLVMTFLTRRLAAVRHHQTDTPRSIPSTQPLRLLQVGPGALN